LQLDGRSGLIFIPQVQIILPAYAKIFRTKSNGLNANAKAYNQKTMPKLSQSDSQNAGSVQADVSDKQGKDGCGIWRDYGATYTVGGNIRYLKSG
jgi:hypothetical protein